MSEPKKQSKQKQIAMEIERMGGKVMPQRTEVEEAVLGALMLDQSVHAEIFQILPDPELFYKEEHQVVFRAVQSLSKKGMPVDMVTVADELRREDKYLFVGGAKFLASLSSKISSAAHTEIHARILLESAIKRELISVGSTATREAFDDSKDVFDIAAEMEKGLQNALNRVSTNSIQSAKSLVEKQQKTRAARKQSGMVGISTGFMVIDKATGGPAPGNLIILAARPSMGKTALVLNITRNVAMQKIPVAFFSMEMSGLELIERLISTHSGIDATKLREERLTDYEEKRRALAEIEIESWPLFVEDAPGLTIQTLRTKAILLKRKFGIGLIVVDYLQLMEGDATKFGQNRETDVSQISRGLKKLAKELDVPVIALSQLSRKVEERGSKKPSLSDLRESGAIEQDADDVWGLMRPFYYGVNDEAEVGGIACHTRDLGILIRLKARHGELGDLALKWHGPTLRFTDYNQLVPETEEDRPF